MIAISFIAMKVNISAVVAFLLFELLVIATINIRFCNGTYVEGCIESERQTLLNFKKDLKDPSNRLASWIGEGDCCKWDGVVCNDLTGYILELHLGNPSEAPQMSKLEGEIPLEVTSLGALKSLNLSQNLFTGKIQESICTMTTLESLDLSANQISGEIPQCMLNLTNLAFLNLSDNNLEGRIPSGGQLQTFEASSFSGNELCGPPLKQCINDGQ